MFKRIVIHVLIASLVLAGFATQVSAAVISTQQAVASEVREQREAQVRQLMSQADVERAMVRLGVDPEQARLRVASLNDAELASVQGQLEQLPAGGGDALVIIGIVFLVLLILELTGVTNVFNRI